MIKKIVKGIPSFVLFVLLAVIYLGGGYILGYNQGYRAGQEDYIAYLNKILEGLRMPDFEQIEPKKDEKKPLGFEEKRVKPDVMIMPKAEKK